MGYLIHSKWSHPSRSQSCWFQRQLLPSSRLWIYLMQCYFSFKPTMPHVSVVPAPSPKHDALCQVKSPNQFPALFFDYSPYPTPQNSISSQFSHCFLEHTPLCLLPCLEHSFHFLDLMGTRPSLEPGPGSGCLLVSPAALLHGADYSQAGCWSRLPSL